MEIVAYPGAAIAEDSNRESRGDYVFRAAVQTSRQVKPLRSAVSLDRLSSFTSAEFRHSRSRSSTLSIFVQPRGDGTRADQLYANIYSHQTAWISDFVRQTDFWPMTNRRLVKWVVPRSINSTIVESKIHVDALIVVESCLFAIWYSIGRVEEQKIRT